MKKQLACGFGFSSLAAVCLLLSSAVPGLGQSGQSVPGQIQALQRLVATQGQQLASLLQQLNSQAQQLATLQSEVDGIANPTAPFGIDVKCDEGQTLTAALAEADLHAGPVHITLYGVCHEAVVLRRSNTTLWAGTPGSGLNPGSNVSPALEVDASWNVRIHDLTLAGGANGLALYDSHVILYAVSIVDNSREGIRLDNSSLSLRAGNTVARNGYAGIALWTHSSVAVDASTITDNANSGIQAMGASFVKVHDTAISDNSGSGIGVGFNSTISVSDSVLERNSVGIAASGVSSVSLNDTVTIRANRGDGLHLADITLAIYGEPVIQDNEGWGVFCGGPPAVPLVGFGSYANIKNNTLGDVNCSRL